MEKCESCGQMRKYLNNGICIFCERGPGGNAVEKEVSNIEHRVRGKVVIERR